MDTTATPSRPSLRTITAALLGILVSLLTPSFAHAQALTATVAVGPDIIGEAINAVTNKIYVLSRGTPGFVTVIDGATLAKIATIPVGAAPFDIAVDLSTNKVFVANSADGTVSIIDGTTNAVVATVKVGINPVQIAVNQKNDHVYILNASIDGTETVIDATSNAIVDQIFGGNDPVTMALNQGSDTLYVIAFQNNDYPEVTLATLYAVVGLIPPVPVFNGNDTISEVLGNFPNVIAANPVTNQVYVGNVHQAGLTVVGYTNGLETSQKTFGTGDYATVAVNSKTNIAYAINGDATVEAVDGNALTDTTIYAGAGLLLTLAINETTNAVYVANDSSPGSVIAIDGQTNASTVIATGSNTLQVAVNPTTNMVYALNGDGTLSVISGIPAAAAPLISIQPQSQTVVAGSTVVFNAATTGRPAPTYQWTFDGTPLNDSATVSGSRGSLLVLTGASAANAGTYALIATNASGQTTSSAATLALTASADPGRIINLSTRARIESNVGVDGSQVLIAGFVIAGSGSKSLVLRGIGPALTGFGVPGAIALPSLALYDAATPVNTIAVDTGWQTPPVDATSGPWAGTSAADATASDFAQVGAFGLTAGSADSAMRLSLPAGNYTTQVTAKDSADGIVLAEVYDADTGTPPTQLSNISSRSFLGNGINAMVAGFVISGTTSKTVLIRASGPALAAFGITSLLTYPNVLLYDGSGNLIGSNAGWGGSPQIAAAAQRVGAFAWTDPASADAALLVTLPPGTYTAEINPTALPYGNALIEVYAVP